MTNTEERKDFNKVYWRFLWSSILIALSGCLGNVVDAIIVGVQDLNHKILDVMGYSKDSWERDYIAYFFSSSNALLIQRWIRSGMTVPPEEMAKLFDRMTTSFWCSLLDKD